MKKRCEVNPTTSLTSSIYPHKDPSIFLSPHSLRRGVWCCRVGRSDFEVGRSMELILFRALNDWELESNGNPS